MPRHALLCAAALAAALAAGPAAAQLPSSNVGFSTGGYDPAPRKTELTAFTGWQFNGDISAYAGTLAIDDAMNYGAAVDFGVGDGGTVQLLWIYSDTTARFVSFDPFYPSTKDFGFEQHYFQVGGTRGVRRGAIEPYGTATLGAALFVPGQIQTIYGTQITSRDTWLFAMTVGGGLKVHLHPRLALRFEGRALLPMYFAGGAIYAGSGGSGMAVSAGIPSFQGSFTAGLTVIL